MWGWCEEKKVGRDVIFLYYWLKLNINNVKMKHIYWPDFVFKRKHYHTENSMVPEKNNKK